MTRAKERGSVVGFVAVGVLLTALLVGVSTELNIILSMPKLA